MLSGLTDFEFIRFALGKMQFDEPLLDCTLLQGGSSGAGVYKLRFATREAVLKMAGAGNGEVVWQRAQREQAFYRELASQLPIVTPTVLAAFIDTEFSALLLPLYLPSPAPAEWRESDFLEVARQLGRFHARFWDKTRQLAHLEWLKPLRTEVEVKEADIQRARGYWQALRDIPHFAELFSPTTDQRLNHLLDHMLEVDGRMNALPLTICHGDCNSPNVLRDEAGHLIWTDWQEVRLGCGPEDLSFFLQQGGIWGAVIPRPAVLDAYHAVLETETGLSISRSSIEQVMDAAELWSRTLYWPAYLRGAPAAQLAEMLQLIFRLADKLELKG